VVSGSRPWNAMTLYCAATGRLWSVFWFGAEGGGAAFAVLCVSLRKLLTFPKKFVASLEAACFRSDANLASSDSCCFTKCEFITMPGVKPVPSCSAFAPEAPNPKPGGPAPTSGVGNGSPLAKASAFSCSALSWLFCGGAGV